MLDSYCYFSSLMFSKSISATRDTVLFRRGSGDTDILQLISDSVTEHRDKTDNHSIKESTDVFRTVTINQKKLEPLLKLSENLTARDDEGQTALHLAVLWCDPATVSSLVAAGADVAAEDLAGLMPVHYAAIAGNLENLKLLSSQLNIPGRRAGRYPLHYASMSGRRKVVAYMLNQGVSIDVQDCHGYTAMVLAAVCEQPEVVKLLIVKGASASVRDNSGISALSVVALHYENLADLLLDRYVVNDRYNNSTVMDLTFILDTEEDQVCTQFRDTSYRMLVRANKAALGHPVVITLTDAKWKMFAKKWFWIKMVIMFHFNLFWTVKYLQTEESASMDRNYWFIPYMFIVAGYLIIVVQVAFTLMMARREYMLTLKLERSMRKTHKHEMTLTHRLTAKYTAKMNHIKYKEILSTTLKRVGIREVLFTLFIDAALLYFTSVKFYAILSHESENFPEYFIRISEVATSLILIILWLKLFWMGSVAPSFGRFVIFTAKTVNDITSILGVYVLLFIPAAVIFYHTIYRHDTTGTVNWYDVPFVVARMAVVDYDFQLGYTIAKKEDLELWWNTLSLTWIGISAIIIMNLFIALMADRYTSLGVTSHTICAQKRAKFVADCELFLGFKETLANEQKLLETSKSIVVRNEGSCFKDDSEAHEHEQQEKLQRDLDLISAKLDMLIAAQQSKQNTDTVGPDTGIYSQTHL